MAKRRASSIEQASLQGLLGQTLTIYLANGKAITGRLLDFDENTLQLSGRSAEDPHSYIKLKHVTTYHEGLTRKKSSDAAD